MSGEEERPAPSFFDLQDDFLDAVLNTTVPVPALLKGATIHRADRRFAVYRNNVAASLVAALRSAFSSGQAPGRR